LLRIFNSRRALIVFALDCCLVAIAWVTSFLNSDFQFFPGVHEVALRTLPYVVLCQGVVFGALGLYKGVWKYASIPDLKRILQAALAAIAVSVVVLFATGNLSEIGRAVWARDFILLVFTTAGIRVAFRVFRENSSNSASQQKQKPVIILGAGGACVDLLQQLRRMNDWKVVGLLDDDPNLSGRLVYGHRVLGGIETIGKQVKSFQISAAILAIPSATHVQRRRILELTGAAGVQLLTVPSLEDIMENRIQISKVRNVEIEDLLGREPVVLDSSGLHRLIGNRVVMVTGAAGSIGSEICRQVAKFQPRLLVFYEMSEPALYHLEQEFLERNSTNPLLAVPTAAILGDVKNKARLNSIMRQYRPDIVFHAAAYKHVPLMEENNSWEALQNNVLGTYTTAQAAISNGVEKFILLSTDKAVNPTSVMGASKRVAEMVSQSLNGVGDTKFITVRFGNVLGSQGSVVPKFREQIEKGGPITVTSTEITRYFMSIPEASQLVLQGALMGEGGEIFVLDMGTPIRIANLAKDMIRLSGLSESEIAIVYTGLRPGEKMYEELLGDGESAIETPHPKLRIAKATRVEKRWLSECVEVITEEEPLEDDRVKEYLKQWVSLGKESDRNTKNDTELPNIIPLSIPASSTALHN